MSQPKMTMRTAAEVYSSQNTIFHRAAVRMGFPYHEHKGFWIEFFGATVRRKVSGLTEMSLGERDQVLKELAKRCSFKIFNPPVPKSLRDWKKGDPEAGYAMRVEGDNQVTKILALWADLGYEPGTIRGLVRRMYKVDDVRWLSDGDKTNLINYLAYRLEDPREGNGSPRRRTPKSR